MGLNVSDAFLAYNDYDVKNLVLVVKIDGVSTRLSDRTVYNRFKYGVGGYKYGDPGLIYGGLVEDPNVLDYLDRNGSSLSIDQSIEPEQGKGSISQLSLSFSDIGGYMTELCGSGNIVPEILGRGVEVFLGFSEIAWPEEYARIFRGYISEVKSTSGKVTFGLSDPGMKSRQELLSVGTTKTSATVLAADTTIQVDGTSTFKTYRPMYDESDFAADPAVTLYLGLGDEWIERPKVTTPVSETSFTGLIRGARDTDPEATTAIDSDVSEAIEIEDHPIDMALKLMLSGRDSPYAEGIAVNAFNVSGDYTIGTRANLLVMPDGVDVVSDYGVTVGDLVFITGGANDGRWYYVKGLSDYAGQINKFIEVESTTEDDTIAESPSSATISFRSKWDTYPIGMGLSPMDVDVERFESIKGTFLNQAEYQMRFFITDDISSGKEFLETNVYKPIGAYSLTRGGKLSLGLTKPPLADEDLRVLSIDNITNPKEIQVTRSVNSKFFNRVDYSYDYNDSGEATTFLKVLDGTSHSLVGVTKILDIEAKGARTDLQVETVLTKRAQFILSRYARGALTFTLKTTFKEGVLIEAGDVVAVRDDGELMLPNPETGLRDMGFKLFEVIKRTLDLKTGQATVTVTSGVGAEASDRFGVIAPSSIIDEGSTTTSLVIKPSFAASLGSNEREKWSAHIGETILVHSEDYSVQDECTIEAFSQSNDLTLEVSGLSITPLPGYIIDVPPYPDTTEKQDNRTYKNLYTFFSPTVAVVGATDDTHLEVDPGELDKFRVGAVIRVHSYDYSQDSGDIEILGIIGSILVTEPMGFVPDATDLIDSIGFKDEGAAYRLL